MLPGTLVLPIGVVRGVEGHVGEEGTARVAADEVRSGVREDVRRVASDGRRLRADTHVIASVVDVRVVIAVARDAADVLVEAPVRRSAADREADVPFAECACRVPVLAQVFRQDPFGVRQADAGPVLLSRKLVAESVAGGIAARQQRSSRRRAGRRRNVEISQPDAFGSEAIDIGSADCGVPVAGEVTPPDVVDVDQDDIGPLLTGSLPKQQQAGG